MSLPAFPVSLAGAEVSCGLLLALAGAGKAYHAVRGAESATAIRRALRVPRERWRWIELAAATAECAIAVGILTWPKAAGVAMAVLGAVFCGLLGYVKATGVPGGCGCLGWQPRYAAEGIGTRTIVRAAVLAVIGIAVATAPQEGSGNTVIGEAFGMNGLFWGGMLAMAVVLVLLSAPVPRTPGCRRPPWRSGRYKLKALTGHEIFAAMAEAAGPFGAEAGHRRAGCDDEFWFWPRNGAPVVFEVGPPAPGGTLTVRAARADSAASVPARRLPVPKAS